MEEDDLEFNLKEKHSRRRKLKALKDKKKTKHGPDEFNISVTGDLRTAYEPYKRDKRKIEYIEENETEAYYMDDIQ